MSQSNKKTLSLQDNPQRLSSGKNKHDSYSVITSCSYQNDVQSNQERPSLDSNKVSLHSSDNFFNQVTIEDPQTYPIQAEPERQNHFIPNYLIKKKPKFSDYKTEEKEKKKKFKPVLENRRINSEKRQKQSKDLSKVPLSRKNNFQVAPKNTDFEDNHKIKAVSPEVIFYNKLDIWSKSKLIESHELYEPGSQAFVILSEASSRNSVDIDQDSLASIGAKKLKVREPSFGLCEFSLIGEQHEIQEVAEKDKKISNFKELMNIITDKEFISSLKTIGKFASFLERNLNNVSE